MATEVGVKLDTGKAPAYRGLVQYFPRALLAVSRVSDKGAEKYTWNGWETVENGYARYSDALIRHELYKGIQGDFDEESGLLHDAHIAWNALARLELKLREMEKDV